MEFWRCYSDDWLKTVPAATFHSLYKYWNSWWRTTMLNSILSRTFLTKEPIYNLTLQMYTSFSMCVCYFYYCCCKLLTNNQTSCWDIAIDIEQVFSKTICTIGLYMMCLMYLSGTMINLIKIYILLHFFKYFFWRNRISKGKVI